MQFAEWLYDFVDVIGYNILQIIDYLKHGCLILFWVLVVSIVSTPIICIWLALKYAMKRRRWKYDSE